jgi:hypothetical protein
MKHLYMTDLGKSQSFLRNLFSRKGRSYRDRMLVRKVAPFWVFLNKFSHADSLPGCSGKDYWISSVDRILSIR